MTTPDPEQLRFVAMTGVIRAINDLVTRVHGDDGFRTTARPGEDPRWAARHPVPLASLAATVVLAGQLARRRERDIRDARGAGHSWAWIGTALGIEVDDDDDARAEAAFDRATTDSWDPVLFTCNACLKTVTDYGPYHYHPDDRETGHASDCSRHRAALAAHDES